MNPLVVSEGISAIQKDKSILFLRIVVFVLIIIVLYKVVTIILNLLKKVESVTETEEQKQEKQNIKEAEALSPYFFTKYYKTKKEIEKYIANKGLSYDAFKTIAKNLYTKGFGNIYDDEEYIYQQIRQMPSLVAISMLSYTLKQNYGMGLDELIDRNLSSDEKQVILNILKKKETK